MREASGCRTATDTESCAFFCSIQLPESGDSIRHDRTIMKQNKNEELQSRRQFFKKAAKATLPILGAIVLAQMPSLANTVNIPNDNGCTCANNCQSGCEGRCADHCAMSCSESCKGACTGGCKGGCGTYCKGNCANGNYQ